MHNFSKRITKTTSCFTRNFNPNLKIFTSNIHRIVATLETKILKPLLCPSLLFNNFSNFTVKAKIVIVTLMSVYATGGVIFNIFWPFPNFYLFDLIFLAITIIVFSTLKYCHKNMRLLCVDVMPYQPFEKANYFYLSQTESSLLYILFPLFFVLSFGIGGVILFSTIELTPTLIWSLTYFAVVVYLSMSAYLQYMRFALYLQFAASSNLPFEKIILPDKKELPPHLPWLIKLTKISHVFRNMFFLVGALYILAFAGFCFLDSFGVNINAAIFYVLWAIIFVFIVIAFPIVTINNMINIKKIVTKTKESYICELIFDDCPRSPNSSINANMFLILRNYCISIILNTSDYPMKGGLTVACSICAAVINLVASVATILQYQATFLN